MKLKSTKLDIVISLIWVFVYLGYLGLLGEWGSLFYLIHTPQILFVLPFGLYFFYTLLHHKLPLLPLYVSIAIFLHLNFFLGREVTLRTIPKIDSIRTTSARICSWNTAYFFKWGKEIGFQRLVEQDCDFILLQEVWKSEENVKEITEVRDWYFPNFDFYSYGEFLIFVPKDSILTLAKSPSNAFFSVSTTFKGKPLELTSVHLWNPITDMPTLLNGIMTTIPVIEAREIQKMDFLAFLSTPLNISTPSIIVGDFNTMPNGKLIRDIVNIKERKYNFISTPVYKQKNTYSTRIPIIQIDFAYISSDYKDYATLKTYCKPVASDHCLLIIDVVL